MTQDQQAGLEPWIVWSNEHRAFWAPNRQGYTKAIEKAGRYSRDEAENICRYAAPRANSTINVGTPPEICMPAPEATPEGALFDIMTKRIAELEAGLREIVRRHSEYEDINLVGKTKKAAKAGTIRNTLVTARALLAKAGGAS